MSLYDNHNDILDQADLASIELYEARKKRQDFLFLLMLGITGFCAFVFIAPWLGISMQDMDGENGVLILILMYGACLVGSFAMYLGTFFKFLSTETARDIEIYHQTYQPQKGHFLKSALSVFASSFVFGSSIYFIFINLRNLFQVANNDSEFLIKVVIVGIFLFVLFFMIIGLFGLYHWGLYIDNKMRLAESNQQKKNIALIHFLVLVGGFILFLLALSFDIVIDIARISREFGEDVEIPLFISFLAGGVNYFCYTIFSLFIWIRSLFRYKG
jgi:hypothetical protein